MKTTRIFAVIMAVLIVLSLCACGGDTKEVNLSEVLTSINTEFSINAEDMKQIEDADTLSLYYFIDAADVKQFAAETTKNSSEDITEFVLIEAVDEDAAERVKTALTTRYNLQRDLCASYSADLLAIVEKCSVAQNGNFVTLIMSNDFDAITAHYNSFFE